MEFYTATEELILSGTFDGVLQGDGQLFSGNETEALITLTDRPGLGNYYLFDFSYNNLFVTRDRFYDGQQFTFSFFYDDLFPKNEEVIIRMVGIDEDFFTYSLRGAGHGDFSMASRFGCHRPGVAELASQSVRKVNPLYPHH